MVSTATFVSGDLKHRAPGADLRTVVRRRGPEVGAEAAFGEVLAAALQRAAWACHRLFDDYAGRVLGYLRTQGAVEPEDLTSEVFLRVFDRLAQFSGDELQFRSWLFTIAHRVLIDDVRRRQRRPRTVSLAPQTDVCANGDVEHEVLANVGGEWADAMLASLPDEQRAVVALRVTADLPLEQVAQILGKRVGAVKSLQHRALASLRRRYQEAPA
jgi:RNA polymerase sigma-70 factor (ECF subfamily)